MGKPKIKRQPKIARADDSGEKGHTQTEQKVQTLCREREKKKDNKQIINNGTIAREFRRFLAT